MRYLKMLGLLVMAVAALTAFASTASATFTSPPGTVYSGSVKATSSNISLDGSVKVACKKSTLEASINSGATSGAVSKWSLTECGNDTLIEEDEGSLRIESNGTTFSTGWAFTVQLHRTVLGFPITTHCTYETNNTHIGVTTFHQWPWIIHVDAVLEETPTDGACGNDAVLTGSYTGTTPSAAIAVD
jgi:hypothetical protein